MKAIDWLKTGILSDEERYVSLRLKAARRLVKGKYENEWGAKKRLVEQSIISMTDATLFVYKNTQLDVVAVKTKMFDMENLGVTGQVALFELIVARKDTHAIAMAKISSPAIRNEFTHLSIWPMTTTPMTRRGSTGTTQTKAPFMLTGQDVWKVKGQLAVQARADATTVEEEEEEEQSLDQMMRSEHKTAYKEAMLLAREKARLGERAGAMAEEIFMLKEDEEIHAQRTKLQAMRKRAVERAMPAKEDEEGRGTDKEGSKRERGPEPDKYGGKLRVIMISHDSTDQVNNYRRAPTRKMQPTVG